MNQDKLNKLFNLATGNRVTDRSVKAVTNTAAKSAAKKIKSKLGGYRGAYVSPAEAWARWYEDSKKEMTSDNVDDVWKFAEENHPSGPDAARDYLRSQVPTERDPFLEESNLRETLTKSPSWFVQEQMPRMNKLGATVSNQNLVKARKIYGETLKSALMKLPLEELDPDVPLEVHLKDLEKLELFGSVDAASIVNGRFAIADSDGNIKPAFMLDGDAVEDSSFVSSVVPQIAEPILSSALSTARDEISLNNKAASGVAIDMLKKGMPVDQWGDAFSLAGSNDMETALSGLAVKDGLGFEDVIRLAAEGKAMYGEQL